MTERLNHNLNVDTIKTIKDVKNIFDTMELDKEHKYYQMDKYIAKISKSYLLMTYF